MADTRIEQILARPARLSLRFVHPTTTPEAGQRLPAGAAILQSAGDGAPRAYVVMAEEVLGGGSLTDVRVALDQQGQPSIRVALDADGTVRLAKATREHIGQPLAIIVDDTVISAPVIRSEILGGNVMISGQYTMEEAEQLAILLRSGALPVPLVLLEKKIGAPEMAGGVGASLTKAIRNLIDR